MLYTLLSVAKRFFFPLVNYYKALIGKFFFKPTRRSKLLTLHLDKTFYYSLVDTIVYSACVSYTGLD